MSISTINPTNGKTLRTFEPYSAVQVSEALDRGVAAFRKHHRTSFAERATRMRKAAGILNAECRELGRLMTVEMGKPIKAAMAEAEKCATACNYYVENAEKFLADPPLRREGAGRSVASAAGKNLKKSVVELGGSDPFIVMPSADLESAVSTAVTARMINNGQSCIAAKRFIVHEKIYDQFLQKFVARVSKVRVGDPMDEQTELGPLATAAIRDELDQQVKASVAAGAKVRTGGKKLDREGFFYAPTVLSEIPPTAPAARDELFGPVASVFTAKDQRYAIRIANGTTFGLGASAWTRDAAEREQFVAEIESGLLFINGMVASDARLPFGGVKHAGFGRELGEFGIREFVNIKSVRVVDDKRDQTSATE